jgi:hypothetical protein
VNAEGKYAHGGHEQVHDEVCPQLGVGFGGSAYDASCDATVRRYLLNVSVPMHAYLADTPSSQDKFSLGGFAVSVICQATLRYRHASNW